MPGTSCGLNSASSNRRLALIQKEDKSCQGNLLSTRAQRITKVSRQTTSSFAMEKTTVRSSELRADRQISETLGTAAKSAGSLEHEFSAGVIDDALAAFLGTEWTTDNNSVFNFQRGTHVAFSAATTLDVDGVDLTEEYVAGDTIKTEGFKNVENNRYWTVTGVAFASNKTTFTISGAVVEAGNVYGTVMDASDVLYSGTTVSTVSGDFKFPANALDALITAGKLERGRHIMVQGFGIGTGSLALTGLPADGESMVINQITFEFDNNGVVGIGAVKVDIGADASATADNLAAAVMAATAEKRLYVSAVSAAGTVTLKALRNDLDVVNAITSSGGITNGTVTNFAGADSTAEGIFTIVSALGDTLVVDPKPANDIAAGATVVIKGSHCTPPSDPTKIIKQTFRVEDHYTDINKFMSYRNQSVQGVTLDVVAEELVVSTVDYVGADVKTLQTTEIGDKVTNIVLDTLTTPLYNATTNVRSIKQDGTIMSATAMSFKLDMKTDVKQLSAVGAYFPVGTNPGSLDITGELEVYFEDTALFQKFFDNAHISIEFVLEDADGNTYVIKVPRAFLTEDTLDNGALDDSVMEKISWTGDLDSVSKATIIFARFSSATPHMN